MSTLKTLKHFSMPQRWFLFVNFVTFQGVWLLCVIWQHEFIALALTLIGLHFIFSPSKLQDMIIVGLVAPIGNLVDGLLTYQEVFIFPHSSYPIWLIALWVAFALTLNHSVAWLSRMPIYMQALLGASGGASSYWAGYRLSAVEFSHPTLHTVLLIAALWAVLLPAFCYLRLRFCR